MSSTKPTSCQRKEQSLRSGIREWAGYLFIYL